MAHRLVWWWVLAFLMWLAMVGALFASPRSAALAFTFVVIPTAPQNLRIQ